jgi:hypothetical protein
VYSVGRTFLVVVALLALLFVVPLAGAAVEYADRGLWAPNVWYNVGDTVTYSGVTYQTIQAHTSQTGWEPPNVPALWKVGSGGPTPTRTNSPAGPTSTRTRTPTPTVTSSGGGGTCWSAWNATAVYTGGAQVSRNGQNYQAAYWTQGNDPATHSGPAGSGQPWIPKGSCGGNATPTPTRTPSRTNTPSGPTFTPPSYSWPSRVSAIYADISFTSIQTAYQATGHKYYALAFVLGNAGTCTPAWDGTHFMSENYYASEINTIRAAGGDVIAVFGGANGSDLASVCTTVSGLQAAYQAVLNQYQFTWIDLNIEGWMVTNTTAIDRLNKAVKALQDTNPNLKVSYTLPVLQSGLPQAELNVLGNAKSNGVRIDYVNVMTMNYGPAGIDMGQASIDAATNTHNQLVGMGIPAQVGITPMIGQNNTHGEIFYLSDADQLLAYARANSYVGWLSFWSLGRDNGGCLGQTTASAMCSGLSQTNYAFTNIFKTFP